MKALQYRTIGAAPEVVEVETPEPGPGQVRLKVTAAGACHSDSFVMSLPEEDYVYGLPLTLGHEGAGVVDKLGDGVTGVEVGTSVAVYGPRGCGRCYMCAQGRENYCERAAELGITPPGLGSPGAMAEYMIVDDARHLVPLGDLDPVANVSLTDAGLTPYHAIKGSLHKLVPGSVAVAIGAGGLGHVGIQILRAISPATVVALDVSEEKLALATEVGAHHAFPSDETAVEEVRRLSGGRGAIAVLDFVGIQPTMDLGSRMLAVGGDHVMVGVGSGSLPAGFLDRPWESAVRAPYWGYRSELFEVLDLARAGVISVETEVFSLDDAPRAYEKLHEGTLRGRAVVVP
ncbi:NAD(P)-dependent alcohol dehydrogenase [Georgenia sp. SUBG003]|uniref:NAD(P)-dependent alcohol dehydrogenase n=1 Tax=Georgenia sp. SUBG003 TaxID=1497974 RepID=UPI0004D5BB9B|nr:alcohol dehydrogenase [Georgenia sp. SUBG003]